ncbi:MAG TPA: prolipoprotein diacylglyceryl transferase, partial [Candidatus Ozemobacteraceae bacterium]|nr:prolipoprotein diacylglyceryl transferase [Candidatus Ozemobacteraceae bacterium]
LLMLLFGRWQMGTGLRFAFFLGWYGTSRFFVEFIRLNKEFWNHLTSDQLLAAGLVVASVIFTIAVPRSGGEISPPEPQKHETPG